MQRSGVAVSISTFTTPQDRRLYDIKKILESTYWGSSEGVFQFQFMTDNAPLTNTISPHRFQLIRFTPDNLNYEAFVTVIPGRLNNDGSIEYGGGRLGMIESQAIKWLDGSVWRPVKFVPPPLISLEDLNQIQEQAYLDSKVMFGHIYKKYMY